MLLAFTEHFVRVFRFGPHAHGGNWVGLALAALLAVALVGLVIWIFADGWDAARPVSSGRAGAAPPPPPPPPGPARGADKTA